MNAYLILGLVIFLIICKALAPWFNNTLENARGLAKEKAAIAKQQ